MKTIDECYHCVSHFVGYLNITFVTFVSRGLVKVSKSYDETYFIVNLRHIRAYLPLKHVLHVCSNLSFSFTL